MAIFNFWKIDFPILCKLGKIDFPSRENDAEMANFWRASGKMQFLRKKKKEKKKKKKKKKNLPRARNFAILAAHFWSRVIFKFFPFFQFFPFLIFHYYIIIKIWAPTDQN